MFRAPQWYGATQTHFPPRPCKCQWHCDITNVISPRGLPIHYNAFRTRRPPKVMRTVSKTSVSYETSSKSHASSLQDERFVETSPKVTRQVSKTSVSRETSSKSQAETPIGAHTSRSLAKQFRDSSPSKQLPLTRQSQCHSSTATHNLTIPCACACHESFRVHTSNARKVLRLPRNVTSVTRRNLTIPCACHENCTSTSQNPHKVLRLPRKVTI